MSSTARSTPQVLLAALSIGILAGCGAPEVKTEVPPAADVSWQTSSTAPTTTTAAPTSTTSATPTPTPTPTIEPAVVRVPSPPKVVVPQPLVAAPRTTVRPAPTATIPQKAAAAPKKTTTTKAPKPQAPKPQPVVGARYANCTEVKAAGAAPIRPGDPGFQAKFDRDNDGIGCE